MPNPHNKFGHRVWPRLIVSRPPAHPKNEGEEGEEHIESSPLSQSSDRSFHSLVLGFPSTIRMSRSRRTRPSNNPTSRLSLSLALFHPLTTNGLSSPNRPTSIQRT
ncbi:hypothetical protein Pst134EA_030457 [Puccinia striiformis f. sp. tritici]|uniref:hypothetical protein n=1 Tax=Puccinia striiformis f. sp. tritici TaxID=168172 RepID=UPI002008BEA1|nr:hypothetical protein Pst134EA_030457 [Puccinia striiformis f. sp. tritici]KAH9446544.1 hypothetical protein Pst134EA_030457 [Puccinia striiformis f. sp. tritici]